MEAEMQATIQGYCEVLESQQNESVDDSFRIKQQLLEQQNINERLQKENNALNEQLILTGDENNSLIKKLDMSDQIIAKLNKKITKYKSKNGVPQSQVKKLEENINSLMKEVEDLKSKISKYEGKAKKDQALIDQLEKEKGQLTNYLSRKEKDEIEYKKSIKEKQNAEKKLVEDMEKMNERLKIAEDCSKLKEENEALLAQRNMLMKFKESMIKDFDKLKQEIERKDEIILKKDEEFQVFKIDAEKMIDRLKKSNDRLSEQMMELDNENINLAKSQKMLEKKLMRLSGTQPELRFPSRDTDNKN